MKHPYLSIVCMAAAAMFAACNEDAIVSGGNGLVKGISISVEDFVYDGVETRSTYSVDESGFHLAWAPGDTVGIFPVGGDQVAFPISGGDGEQSAQFDGGAWALRASYSYAAYYPYERKNIFVSEKDIPVDYTGQTQDGNGSLAGLGKYDFQASTATKPDAEGNVDILLKHLGCFVKVQVSVPVADTFKAIMLTSDGEQFLTAGTYNLSETTPSLTATKRNKSVRMELENVSTSAAGQVLTFYMMIAPADLKDATITATLSGTKNSSYSATFIGVDMKAGRAYAYSATNTKIDGQPETPVENDPDEPTNTGDATEITSYSAIISAFINAELENVSEVGLLYSTDENLNKSNGTKATVNNSSVGSDCKYSVKLSGLSDNTRYYYRSYYISGGIWFYGKILSFSTLPQNVGVTFETGVATNVVINSAIISTKLIISESSVYDKMEYGFYWGDSSEPTTKQTITSKDADGCYSYTLTKLDENTEYYYRPYAILDGTVFYGTTRSFNTLSASSAFETGTATNVTCYSAKVGVKLSMTEFVYSSYKYGICWDTIPEPTYQQKVASKDADGNYTATLKGLYGSKVYYYRPYAIMDGGTFYGDVSSFKTLDDNVVATGDINTETYTVTSTLSIGSGAFSSLTLGVCYGTNAIPTINDKTITTNEVDEDNNFTLTLLNIKSGTNYYYRAYVLIDGIPHYGNAKSYEKIFNTNGKSYVDLGLSVLWATCNVGATNPEDYGDYFAWGETEGYLDGKTNFSLATYKLYQGDRYYKTKYCTNSDFGIVDNKTVLDSEDDAAHVNWGGAWRMPTSAEITELRNNCTWSWTTENGVNGYKVTSNSNSNSIFLPAAGYREGTHLLYAGSGGDYWSSSLSMNYTSDYAWYLNFYSGDRSTYDFYDRWHGFSVRPVCE